MKPISEIVVSGLIERTELNIFNPDQSLVCCSVEMQILLIEASTVYQIDHIVMDLKIFTFRQLMGNCYAYSVLLCS